MTIIAYPTIIRNAIKNNVDVSRERISLLRVVIFIRQKFFFDDAIRI